MVRQDFCAGVTDHKDVDLKKLHENDIKIVSLVCDGPSCHFSMVSSLNASLDPETLRPFFPHPSNNNEEVCMILEVCNMLKLFRNYLGHLRFIFDKDGKRIDWGFIRELQRIQEE